MKPKLRVSSSVIGFRDRALKTWGLEEWQGVDDPCESLVFFGLYHERDFAVFETFEPKGNGKRIVFWCGSDISRVIADYERRRILNNYPDTIHYCENEVEQKELADVGYKAEIIPSFLDDINNYEVSFKAPTERKWKIWLCAHPEREDEYGVALCKRIAGMDPELEFHIYGITKNRRDKDLPNIIYHDKVPESQLNEEIKQYHCGFRPNHHDGFSEVTAKSVLMGQYPITRIPYEGIWTYKNEPELLNCIKQLKEQKEPNIKGRDLYRTRFNNFPFLNE